MIFKPRTAIPLTLPDLHHAGTRQVSLSVEPHDARCTLSPVGDRRIEPLLAVGTQHQTFILGPDIPPWGATLTVEAPGYVTATIQIPQLPMTDTELAGVALQQVRAALPRLAANSGVFELAGGTPWTWIGCTDFRLFKRHLDGDDLEPVLAQRAALGFTILRVLFSCDYMFRLHPAEVPAFYAEAERFFARCAAHGLYVEAVAFADTKRIFREPRAQLAHWAALGAAAATATNVVLELVNENSEHENGVWDPTAFRAIPGVLCSHGSNGAGAMPVRPVWDFETFHWNGMSEWTRKCAHNPMEDGTWQHGLPAVSDENTRFPDRCSDPIMARDAAAGAALLGAGSTYHSEPGKYSALFTGLALDCAQAWASGAASVPLEFQRGRYNRIEKPPFLRVYQRILSNGRAHTVEIAR